MKRLLRFARSFGTFANYLGYLRAACHAIGCTAPPVGHPAIKRSMIAIVKRELYKSREKLHLDRIDVRNMVLAVNNNLETLQFAMLWLVSYTFLLRLPSEVSSRAEIVHSPFTHSISFALSGATDAAWLWTRKPSRCAVTAVARK